MGKEKCGSAARWQRKRLRVRHNYRCRNYLFSKSDSGAVDNTIFHSLTESCDIVGVEPLRWLTHMLANLHDDTPAGADQTIASRDFK